MKIAIVGPSPVPYSMGGMEYLLWGLYEHINKETSHSAELIKLPTAEGDFWSLIESYKKYHSLNLDHFDMVISCKYPTWMVRHRNHVCYMAHRLRGLYDTYSLTNLPLKVESENVLINNILNYLELDDSTLDGLFKQLDELYVKRYEVNPRYFEFPGPFIRAIIHFLDGQALNAERTSRFTAISKTVRSRKSYFPNITNIDVIYPPSFLNGFKNDEYDYLFTVSRLDNAKRVGLMIQAMEHVKGDVKFRIAGVGPQEAELKALAAKDDRIEFLGFVNDDELIDYYARAKAVLFMPYEEDYGLVTIEAMMSHKPVITCSDSGGPKEFVIEDVTGYIADPNPVSIGEKISKVISLSQEELREMGDNAYNMVKDITWSSVINGLLQQSPDKISAGSSEDIILEETAAKAPVVKVYNGKRKKITITSTFPMYPPVGGGQARMYNIYKRLAEKYDIEVVSFTQPESIASVLEIGEGFKEIRIPKSEFHDRVEWKLQRMAGIQVTDTAMPLLSRLSDEYSYALESSIVESDLVIACHPFLIGEIGKYIGSRPLIYEAHDVEYHIKGQSYPKNAATEELLDLVYQVEKECCDASTAVITCSENDSAMLSNIYDISAAKISVVPNGIDCKTTKFVSQAERMLNKRKAKLQNEKMGIFIGSWHPPNLEACENIFNFAQKTKDVKYLIMGSQCIPFQDRKLPENVVLLGTVDEKAKEMIMGFVDFAVNPMVSGSGTNLKMFDYMASGIPVITTSFGARGIDNDQLFVIEEIESFPDGIKKVLAEDTADMINNARTYVENNFDWDILARVYLEKIDEIL